MSSDLPENSAEQTVERPDYESAPLSKPDPRKPDSPLTRRDAALVVIRLIALYDGLLAALSLLAFISQNWDRITDFRSIYFQGLLPAAIYCTMFIVLWLAAWPLSAWVCRVRPNAEAAAPEPPASRRADLLAVGVALLGVWLLAFYAIPGITQELFAMTYTSRGRNGDIAAQFNVGSLVAHGMKFAIGVYLFRNSRKLGARWAKLPTESRPPEDGPL